MAAMAPYLGDEAMTEGGDVDWFKEEITMESDNEFEMYDGLGGILVVSAPKDLRKDLVEPWKNTFILKFCCETD